MSPRFGEMGSAAEDSNKNELADGQADDYNKAEIVDLDEHKEGKENKGENTNESLGGNPEQLNVEVLKAETERAGLDLAKAEAGQEEAFAKIQEALPDAKLPEGEEGLSANFENKRTEYVEAILENGGTPAEALEAKIQTGIDVADAKTESKLQKVGGALMAGARKVGEWVSTDPGKKIVAGAGMAATVLGGPMAWARRLAKETYIRSDKIAKKFGASEETVEKISKFTKEASAAGVGKRVSGMAENAQARYAERKASKFEAMSQEEKMAHLAKFDGSTLQKLEKALTSKTAAKVAGLIAGVAIVFAAGSAMGGILEGHINIPTGGGFHESITNVPDDAHEQVASAAGQHVETTGAASQAAKGSFKFGEGHRVGKIDMEKVRQEDAEAIMGHARKAQEAAGMQGSAEDVQGNFPNDVNHEGVANNASQMEAPKPNNDIAAALNKMKKPDLTETHPTHAGGFEEHQAPNVHEAVPQEQVAAAPQAEEVASAKAESAANQIRPQQENMIKNAAAHAESRTEAALDNMLKSLNKKITMDNLDPNSIQGKTLNNIKEIAMGKYPTGAPLNGERPEVYVKRVLELAGPNADKIFGSSLII